MEKKYPIINILTYGLPHDLANQIYNEYQARLKEANYIIEISKKYGVLKEQQSIVETLLAISIFHKRVIANLDGAVKFYGTVNKFSDAEVIAIGSYNFTGDERNKIVALLMNYRQLLQRFEISEGFMDYFLTKDFLKNILNLKSYWDYASKKNDDQQS